MSARAPPRALHAVFPPCTDANFKKSYRGWDGGEICKRKVARVVVKCSPTDSLEKIDYNMLLKGCLWYFGQTGFFSPKKTRTLFDLQKRVLKIWRRPSSQKASIFPKESVGEHFTTARATLRAKIAPPPQTRPEFLKFASTWDGKNCAQRARRCARAHDDIKFEFSW